MQYLLYLVSFLSFFSCNTSESVHSNSKYQHSLSLTDSLILPLDSVSRPMSKGLFFIDGKPNYLVKANLNNWRIDIYDLSIKKVKTTVPINKEGPDGVGQIPSGLYFHNMDSIFLFFNLQQSIKMINHKGQVVDYYYFTKKTIPIVDINSYRPAFILNKKLYMSTYDNSYEDNSTSGAILNLKSGKITYPYTNPEIYNTGYWQGILYDNFFTIKDDNNNIINSYGADHFIYVYTKNGSFNKYCAKSDYLSGEIEPFRNQTVDFGDYAQQIYKFETLQGGYSYMIYDKYQNVYYRIALTPVSKSQFKTPQQLFERPSVIILNKDFKKIGEFLLPKGHKHTQMFVSEEGLNILNEADHADHEDRVMYSVFKIIKI